MYWRTLTADRTIFPKEATVEYGDYSKAYSRWQKIYHDLDDSDQFFTAPFDLPKVSIKESAEMKNELLKVHPSFTQSMSDVMYGRKFCNTQTAMWV